MQATTAYPSTTPRAPQQAAVVTVTPEMAESWLENNVKNRPASEHHVRRYAALMTEGRWMLSCDAIGFDAYGRLINGQHRLQAVIESGVPSAFLVARDLDPDVFEVLDVGKRRSAGDALAILGFENYTSVASIARMYANYLDLGRLSASIPTVAQENDRIVEIASSHEAMSTAAKAVLHYSSQLKGLASPSVLGFLYFICIENGEQEAGLEFVRQLATGLDLNEWSPVAMLRDRLIRDAMSKERLPRHEVMALIIKSMAKHLKGESVRSLRYSPGAGEAFPQLPFDPPAASEESEE